MRTAPYSSRDTFYKSVFGSVESGKDFTLRVLLPRDGYVQGVVAVFDKDGNGEQRFEMFDDKNSFEGGFYTRSCNISLDEGLYFYYFVMYTVQGERLLLDMGGGVGEFDPLEGKYWQLTVYEKGFSTPEHIKGGIIYQIFPDRFAKGENNLSYPNDRLIREDWGGEPIFTQTDPVKKLGNDYFCGNLKGIENKLEYLKELGVTIIYLNPIFEAHSNHRYNTADYMKIDPLLGSEEDFISLCKKAKEKGIDIILDGVFSHTGNDSKYFNSKNRYNEEGAANSVNSPYYSWYKFEHYPDKYSSWWGISTLPEINENDPSFTEFITGENGVIRYWMKRGAAGFRLDVADELPDEFLDNVRKAIKTENNEGYLLGEVWEDATNKISYGYRRRFLRGRQLDSVMNYPFANAITEFVKGGTGYLFAEKIMTVVENYPSPALHTLMNHIGTHDTPRIITQLAGEDVMGRGRQWQFEQKMSNEEYKLGVIRLKTAAVLQYTLPGIPSLYYGDEVGLYGYGDPFCRRCFPWGHEDKNLIEFYKNLGKARKICTAFKSGNIKFLQTGLGFVIFERREENSFAIIGVNRWHQDEYVYFDMDLFDCTSIFGEKPKDNILKIPACGFVMFIK